MISAIKKLIFAKKFYDADRFFDARDWIRSSKKYAEIVIEFKAAPETIVAATLYSRLTLSYFNIGNNSEASANYMQLISVLRRVKAVNVDDLNWLFVQDRKSGV